MNTMDEGDIILGSNTINNQQSGEHLDTLNSNTDGINLSNYSSN